MINRVNLIQIERQDPGFNGGTPSNNENLKQRNEEVSKQKMQRIYKNQGVGNIDRRSSKGTQEIIVTVKDADGVLHVLIMRFVLVNSYFVGRMVMRIRVLVKALEPFARTRVLIGMCDGRGARLDDTRQNSQMELDSEDSDLKVWLLNINE
ncbi:hypothetical protein HZH66_000626 [Vespula vulgaris]|uniref:Uncharacterized protein n=1 Tax=Vespula vulgaris TaxID=7454 RepID=A0A834KSR6_VESVU|nr:hypothetical protein HZH66_000626 [Vespula vulgaris]